MMSIPKGSRRLDQSIALQTRTARDIPNQQKFQVSQHERNAAAEYPRRYAGNRFCHRTGLNPIYNCHGLTFASRRTWIYKAKELREILEDDCYFSVSEPDALPGDVVLYVQDDGDIDHSGLVVCAKVGLEAPIVLSKWGSYGEVVHPLRECPYPTPRHEFYRVTT